MDLRDPNTWISHLLENLPDDKLACALKDDNPGWEYIDGEMLKLGSLAHSQLDIPEIQRRGLVILASESKDFRLLAHLLRTLQHAGDPLLALRSLALYVEHYWTVAAPQNAAHKQRFATQVLKRFETGVESFAETARTAQRDSLLAELAKLAQRWQEQNIPALTQAVDDLSSQYRRAFRGAAPVPPAAGPSTHPAPVSATPSAPVSPSAPAATTAPAVDIDSHDDKAWRDTLLKVAAILCERQPDSPQGYRLRRHALWQAITSVPQAESDGRTPLAAVPADMTADYQARLNNADLALWQQVEKACCWPRTGSMVITFQRRPHNAWATPARQKPSGMRWSVFSPACRNLPPCCLMTARRLSANRQNSGWRRLRVVRQPRWCGPVKTPRLSASVSASRGWRPRCDTWKPCRKAIRAIGSTGSILARNC